MKDYVKIGDVVLKRTAARGTMASVADTAFRLICKEFKACLVFSEMVSVKGICYNSKASVNLLKIKEEERPMALQLFGEDPEFFKKALPVVLLQKPDIIDLNMCCPVNKVVKSGAGCALMKNVKLAEKIASVVVKNSSVPVTVKIRKGWDSSSCNFCEFAKRMEACGVSAITLHPRTRSQMFSEKADWQAILKLKNTVKIPVIASGDIKTAELCKKAYEETGADLVMIARASLGKPWIFKQVDDLLTTGEFYDEISLTEIFNVMLNHIKKIIYFEGEERGIKKARFHALRYFNSFKNAAKIRKLCCEISSYEDVLKLKKLILGLQWDYMF